MIAERGRYGGPSASEVFSEDEEYEWRGGPGASPDQRAVRGDVNNPAGIHL